MKNLYKTIKLNSHTYYLPDNLERLYKDVPQLKSPEKGDWYIYYNIWDFENGGWRPVKSYTDSLNKKQHITNPSARKKNGKLKIEEYLKLLEEGINPKDRKFISPEPDKSLKEVLAQLDHHTNIPTVEVAIEKWLLKKAGKDTPNKIQPENKQKTESVYNYFFKSFLTYLESLGLAGVKINEVPAHVVYEWFEIKYNKGEWADTTYNVQLGWLKAPFNHYSKVYNFASPLRLLEDKEANEDSERFEAFTVEDLKVIFKTLDSPYTIKYACYEEKHDAEKMLALVCRIIFYCFLRVSEIQRMKIKHVRRYKEGWFDLDTTITKNKKKIFNQLYLEPLIIAYLQDLGWEKYFNDRQYDDYYVFTPNLIPSKKRTNDYQFGGKFKKIIKSLIEAGKLSVKVAKNYSIYSLKASGNIAAYNAGWDIVQISLQNRHTTITQTETYLRSLKVDIAARARPPREAV
ncbi:site-specific integrase [Pedobacter sp. SYSU D00535]|uniref:site-specific integrase n=1 Tax=Pedobacter sp. SYSU D00535 TaxID=2810308 RepID=UPI001A963369|nr:site-specific integrase [Pedobacter sp. SYSU D00535]